MDRDCLRDAAHLQLEVKLRCRVRSDTEPLFEHVEARLHHRHFVFAERNRWKQEGAVFIRLHHLREVGVSGTKDYLRAAYGSMLRVMNNALHASQDGSMQERACEQGQKGQAP